MIEPKKKICKGSRKDTIGHGCETEQYMFKFGLCKKCFIKWLKTEQGRVLYQKTLERSKKVVLNALKRQATDKRKAQKESIKTKSDYEKELQTIINWIVREIDKDKGCISCDHGWNNDFTRQRHAGHRLSVGSTPELRFNVLNIFGQCSICNNWLSGNQRDYDHFLTWAYGPEFYDVVLEQRKKYQGIKLTIEDLKEAIANAKQVQKMLKNGQKLSRPRINELINIYKKS